MIEQFVFGQLIILVINKSDSRCAVVRFCYHSYDYRLNWTPLSPITITYCSNADSIEQTFVDCTESVKLYSQIISWLNHCRDAAITFSKEKVAFHDLHHVTDMLSGPVRRRLDLLIILVKQCIYSSKHLQKELSLDELVKKLTTQWKLEKCI